MERGFIILEIDITDKPDKYYLSDCRMSSFSQLSPHFAPKFDFLKFAVILFNVYRQAKKTTTRTIISWIFIMSSREEPQLGTQKGTPNMPVLSCKKSYRWAISSCWSHF